MRVALRQTTEQLEMVTHTMTRKVMFARRWLEPSDELKQVIETA